MDTEELERLFSGNIKAYVEKVEYLKSNENQLHAADKAKLHFYVGRAYLAKSDYEHAEDSFREVLNSDVGTTLKYRATMSLANLHQHTGNFYQAFSYAFLLNGDEFSNLSEEVLTSGVLVTALALMESGLYDEAKNTLSKLDFETVAAKSRCTALYLVGQIAYKSNIFTLPLEQMLSENKKCVAEKQLLYAYLSESAISMIYLNKKQTNDALKILLGNRQKVLQLGYENLTVAWQAILLSALVQIEDSALVLEEARELETFLQSKAIENSMEVALLAYQSLAGTYRLLGDHQKTTHYLELYQQTYQKSHNKQMTAALAYYAALMQAAQRKQEIATLNQQSRQLQLETELAKAETVNNRLYLLVALTLVVLLISVLYRSHRAGIQLKERVTFDKLTRVFSRDHFEEVLSKSLMQAQHQQQKLGFVLFDLDNFKQVNDSYGHQTGDWVLQQAANAAQQCLRKSDAIGRIGGEEFAILLQDCDLAMSCALAESVRLAIADIDTSPTGYHFNVTASLGASTAHDYAYNANHVFSVADEALYQAKQSGRNKVMPELEDQN